MDHYQEKEQDNVLKEKQRMILRKYQILDQIIQNIAEGNEPGALELLKKDIWQEMGNGIHDVKTIKYNMVVLNGLIVQKLRRNSIMDIHLDDCYWEYLQKIDRIRNIQESRKITEEMVREFCGFSDRKELQTYSMLVQRIIYQVDMDLTQPLTLHYFAGILNVNASYLSNLFRKETGETITQYVTQRRVARAKNLLATSGQPIKSVAKQVGIADVQYFSKLFKRETGDTPSQYREKISKL